MAGDYDHVPTPSAEEMEANIALLRRWIKVGWNERNMSIIDEVFHEDIISEGAVRARAEPLVGVKAVIEFQEKMITAIPDIHIEILNMVSAADIVIGEYLITGTHLAPFGEGAPSPKDKVEMNVTEVARFRDGRIFHRRTVISDARGVMARFGVR
jgi:predicted ester cyclase